MSEDNKSKKLAARITMPNRDLSLKERGYHFMPASLDSLLKGLSVSVKYRSNGLEYKSKALQNGFVLKLPDRTLHMSRSFIESEKRSPVTDADFTIDMDPYFNKALLGHLGLSFAMVNASSITSHHVYPDYDKEAGRMWPYIVADSGGFQLSTGACTFLDPKAIVERHNQVCDIGVTLDIPLRWQFQKELLLRTAKIQQKNNEVFDRYRRPSLHLQNTFHGATFYSRNKYREYAENLDTPRCCVAGLKASELVPMMLCTIQVITTGRKYAHYHVLGASGLERWVALSYLGHKKLAPVITSDSSSHIQAGINMQMFNPMQLVSNIDLRQAVKNYNHAILPCSCEVCSTIKYARVFTDKSLMSFPYELIVLHNLYVSKQYVDEIWNIASLPKIEILRVLKHFCNEEKLKTISSALSAIDMALEEGVEKAAAKYAPFLLNKWPSRQSKGIFKHVQGMGKDRKMYDHLIKVVQSYEKTYGIKS